MNKWEEQDQELAEELVKKLSTFVNCMTMQSREKFFCEIMGREHRTLQQNFSKLVYAWIQEQSKQFEEGNFDPRNEYAVKTANQIATSDELKYAIQLPLI